MFTNFSKTHPMKFTVDPTVDFLLRECDFKNIFILLEVALMSEQPFIKLIDKTWFLTRLTSIYNKPSR